MGVGVVRRAIALVALMGCGGAPFSSAAQQLVEPLEAGELEAAADADGALEAGALDARRDRAGPPVDGSGVDGGESGVDGARVDGGGGGVDGDAAATCTPLPHRNFLCGQYPTQVGCLLENGEACELGAGDAGSCLTVAPACACLETYSCACVAPGQPCSVDDAGIVTEGP